MPTIEVKADGCCWLDGEPVGPADRCEIRSKEPLINPLKECQLWPEWIAPRITWQLWCGGSLVREFKHSDTTVVVDSVGEHQPREDKHGSD